MRKVLFHIGLVVIVLVCTLGIPLYNHQDIFGENTDATSSASVALPDSPSGEFIVLMNTSMHKDSMDEWDKFFHDEDFGVIFDDVSCLYASGDVTGQQLAERFQIQLPENQMSLSSINPTLLVSKIENGYIDIAVMSQDMADILELDMDKASKTCTVFKVSGGTS